jgi:hypothetical protein
VFGLHTRRPERHRPRHSATTPPPEQNTATAAVPEQSTHAPAMAAVVPAIADWAPPPKPGPDLAPPLSQAALAVLDEIDDRLQEHLRIYGPRP